jgi:hypothetical protein
MPLWSRIANMFRNDRLNLEIDEELTSHIAEAVDEGRDPAEARKAFGSTLRQREASRDVVLFSAGLFVATAARLSNQSTGFVARQLLNLDTVAQEDQPPALWYQVVQNLRAVPGVEKVALLIGH